MKANPKPNSGQAKANSMFGGWDNFYVIVGSAAGALIGLLFVVATLTAGYDRSHVTRGVNLYMTPTAVHFAVVLAISAMAMAPGLTVSATAAILGLVALAGLANAIRACLGIRSPSAEREAPHWSDFWLYGAAPAAIYVGLGGAAVALCAGAAWAPHATGGLLLALLFVGIRNAWDLVTWMAPRQKGDAQ